MQRELTLDEVREIVARVHYEKGFRVERMDDGYFVQIFYDEPDIRDGTMTEQRGRKWYVSRFATDSEIVQTCLRAALDSAEHQVREHFAYIPREVAEGPGAERTPPLLIYGPHFSADFLYNTMREAMRFDHGGVYDAREDPS